MMIDIIDEQNIDELAEGGIVIVKIEDTTLGFICYNLRYGYYIETRSNGVPCHEMCNPDVDLPEYIEYLRSKLDNLHFAYISTISE